MFLSFVAVTRLSVPSEDLDYCEGSNLLDLSIKKDTTHASMTLLSLGSTTGGNDQKNGRLSI